MQEVGIDDVLGKAVFSLGNIKVDGFDIGQKGEKYERKDIQYNRCRRK